MCTTRVQCPQRPVEGVGSLGTGIKGWLGTAVWVLGSELRSSRRAASTPNLGAIFKSNTKVFGSGSLKQWPKAMFRNLQWPVHQQWCSYPMKDTLYVVHNVYLGLFYLLWSLRLQDSIFKT